MNIHLIAYFIGIFIVIATHLYFLYKNIMKPHAILNLVAGTLIAYYFMNKEGYTNF